MFSKYILAIAAVVSGLLVSFTPLAAYSSDPCDPRLQGWEIGREGCGSISASGNLSLGQVSHNYVDVRTRDVRVDFHMDVVASYGFSDIRAECGDYEGLTGFGLNVRRGDLSTLTTFGRADGGALPFPVTVREYRLAGVEKSFEMKGSFIVPKGTKSFEGFCSLSVLGPRTFDNNESDGERGEWSFRVEGSLTGNIPSTPGSQEGVTRNSSNASEAQSGSNSSRPSPSQSQSQTNNRGSRDSNLSLSPTQSLRPRDFPTNTFPAVSAGSSKIYANGLEVEFSSKRFSAEDFEVATDDGLNLKITTPPALSPNSINQSEAESFALVRYVTSRFRASGFAPNSPINLWLFSTPTKLIEVTTDENGEIQFEFDLPDTVEAGEHNLQISGLHPDGSTRDIVIGVSVMEKEISDLGTIGIEAGSQNQGQTIAWVLAALLGAVLTVSVVVLRHRMQDKKPKPKS